MAGVNIDDFGASYVYYISGVTKTLNNTSRARLLSQGKLKWEGKYLEKQIHVRRNAAIAGTVDGGAIPSAGKQSYIQSQVARKFIVGSVQVTDGILDNAATTKHAAITAMNSELRGLLDSIRKWENYWFTRDGTGVVTLLGSDTGTADTTLTVDDGRMMWEDAYYDILSTAGVFILTFQVSKVARALTAAGECTITTVANVAALGQADGDYIVWRGSTSSGENSYNKIPMGLEGMIDDTAGSFQGVACGTYNRWTSPVLANATNRPLRPELFRQACSAIKQESGEDPKSEISALMTYWQGNQFEEMYEGQLRLQPNTTTVGLKTSSFQSTAGNVSVVTDPDTPYHQLYLLDSSEITRATQHELDWRKEGKSGIFKRDDGNLRWTATCLETCEYFIDRRNRCARIDDLEENRVTALG